MRVLFQPHQAFRISNVARKFLYLFAGLIVLVIAGGFVFSIYQDELTDLRSASWNRR